MLGLLRLFTGLIGTNWYTTVWILCLRLVLRRKYIYIRSFRGYIDRRLLIVNKMSTILIWMTVIVALARILARQKTVKKIGGIYNLFLLVFSRINIFLIGFFSLRNILGIYFIFEASLIPIFLLILGWGYQPERLLARTYLIIYTVFGSLPLLLFLCWLNLKNDRGNIFFLFTSIQWYELSKFRYIILSLAGILGFSIKFPIYGVHNWLPKAHVEAPVAGSIVLAGVLLKIGGYGIILIIRIFNIHFAIIALLASIFIWGGVLAGVVCFIQTDIKTLIAYSSISHIAFSAFGLLINMQQGWTGSLRIIIGHGLCSPAIFCLAAIIYSVSGSRRLLVNKGLLRFFPALRLIAALVCRFNLRSPPTLSLLGEYLVYSSCIATGYGFRVRAALITFLSIVFSIFLYISTQHGPSRSIMTAGHLKSIVYLPLLVLVLPLNLFIFLPLWGRY